MNSKLRQQLTQRKRRLTKNDKRNGFENVRIRCNNVKYNLAEQQHVTACGVLGMITQLVK